MAIYHPAGHRAHLDSYHFGEPLPGRERRHRQDFQHQHGGVEYVRAEESAVDVEGNRHSDIRGGRECVRRDREKQTKKDFNAGRPHANRRQDVYCTAK